MVPLPKVQTLIPNEQYRLVKDYCDHAFWSPDYDSLFHENIVVDFPHAPPGFLQHYSPFEFSYFRVWLQKIILSWENLCEPTIIQTTDENIIWAVYFRKARLRLAKRECDYQNEHAVRFTLKDGTISGIKDYFNPLSFYHALGIVLPSFRYDPIDDWHSVRMPEGSTSKFTLEQNVQRAVNNFSNPIEADDDPESIYSSDVLEVCPQAPYSMTEAYSGKAFDVQTEWMFRACPEWITMPKCPCYQGLDPNIIIVESEGYGRTTWSKTDGHYCQRELQIAFLRDGKVFHFRVYFNPINKFSSMNQQIPTIPFMNY